MEVPTPEELETAAEIITGPQHEASVAKATAARLLLHAAAEIRFWRGNQALIVERGMRYMAASITPETLADAYVNMLRPDLGALLSALEGDVYLGTCEACAKPVKIGDLVVTYEDVGDMHAACAGATAEQLVDGGKIPLDPDEVILEEGEEPPVDPHMLVHVASDFLDPERIAKIIAEAEAVSAAYLAPTDDAEDEA